MPRTSSSRSTDSRAGSIVWGRRYFVRTVGGEVAAVLDRQCGIEVATAVGERGGGHVQNTHDQAAARLRQTGDMARLLRVGGGREDQADASADPGAL